MLPLRLKVLALAALLSACSVQYDAQYGLRLAPPAVRSPKSQDVPANADGYAPSLALAEPTPAEVDELPHELWDRAAPLVGSPAEDASGLVEPERTTATPGARVLVESAPAAEAQDEAATLDLEALDSPGATLPLWAENLIGILLALLAVGLVALGGLASVLAVVSFGFGDVAFGWLMVAAAVAALIGGYFLYRFARPMLPELNFYWLSNPVVRIALGIVSFVFFLLALSF